MFETLQLNKLGELFTSQALNSLATGNINIILDTLENHFENIDYPISIADVFEIAYSYLSHSYKSEYLFKNIITNNLFLNKSSNKNSVMLSEFRVGQSKADCVIIDSYSTCYEIKTSLDNLKRLPEQLSDYTSLFDKVYVVCDKSHIDKVYTICQDEVGIIELTSNNKLINKRKATVIDHPLDATMLINSLRANEYKYIAEKITKSQINVPNVDLYDHCLNIFNSDLTINLRKHFIEAIKLFRKNNHAFIDSLPRSLKSSAISFNIPPSRQRQLKNIMSKYIQEDYTICTSHSCEVSNLS